MARSLAGILKKGPVDWNEMIKAGRPFEDQDFKGVDAIYWNDYASDDYKQKIDAAGAGESPYVLQGS